MHKRLYILSIIVTITILWGCSNTDDIRPLDPDFAPDREIAEGVKMIYSDSAILQFTIETPRLEKYYEDRDLIELFPKGLKMKFYDRSGVITTTLSSKYAIRVGSKGTMLLQDSVVLTNKNNDILTSPKIIWDKANNKLESSKFVRLIRSATKDTLYGNGFHADGDFSRFKLTQATGKRRYQNLVE